MNWDTRARILDNLRESIRDFIRYSDEQNVDISHLYHGTGLDVEDLIVEYRILFLEEMQNLRKLHQEGKIWKQK